MKKKWIINGLLILFALLFVCSLGFLLDYYVKSKKAQQSYDDLAQLVEDDWSDVWLDENWDDNWLDKDYIIDIIPQETEEEPEEIVEDTAPSEEGTKEPLQSIRPKWVKVKHPETGEPVTVLPQLAKPFILNSDMVGWIKIPDTKINYPVMQTPDDPDFYLARNFSTYWSNHGCIYAEEACDINAPSDNITIYGHRMRDGSMFAGLQYYTDESYFKEHPYIQFSTLTETYTYRIMSVIITSAIYGKGFVYHSFVDAYDALDFEQFVYESKKLSLYETGVRATYGDKLITLSTCEYTEEEGRLVIVAKRITPVCSKPHPTRNKLSSVPFLTKK